MWSPSPRTRRVAAGAVGAGVVAGGALLATGLLVARRLVPREEVVGARPGGEPQVRVAHLSDLHLDRLGTVHRDAARAVNAFRPDVVALTGDLLQHRRGLLTLEAFLELLDPAPALVAVPGNWDYAAGVVPSGLERALAAHGGELLVNECRRLDVAGLDVLITGLDDPVKGAPDLPLALAGQAPADVHVLLVHAPVWRDGMGGAMAALARHEGAARARALEPQLILAGHTHGGQVRLGSLAWTPRGSGDYLQGWYGNGSVPMFVSPGVGTVVPVRIGARPEVGLFRIVPPR